MFRCLMLIPFVAIVAACSTPSTLEGSDLGGLTPVAEASQMGPNAPDAPDAEIVVAAAPVAVQTPVTPQVAADAEAVSKNCAQAWHTYEQAQVAIHTDATDPKFLAVKQAGTALASAAIAQGARAGVDLINFLSEHPEAAYIARAQTPETSWPTSFYDCFGRSPSGTKSSSAPSASSASTASTAPQPVGPSVAN